VSVSAPGTQAGKVAGLAEELGWPGSPSDDDAAALEALLDDELETLATAQRRAFVEQLKVKCPDAVGPTVLVCADCNHAVLARYRPDNGRCRACSRFLDGAAAPSAKDSGFGFVLADYGASGETVVRGADADTSSAWSVTEARAQKVVRFDAENRDWDELQDEVEAQRAREAAERAEREAREKAEREAREAELRKKMEAHRPALGCVLGAEAGKVVRIEDMPEEGAPATTGFWIVGGIENPKAKLVVGADVPVKLDGKPQPQGEHDVEVGVLVEMGEEVFALDETAEMDGIVAEAIHFARDDKQPGGPWPYWNEEVTVGAAHTCQVQVVDDAVASVHARIVTRFGQHVIEDLSPGDGVLVNGARIESALLVPDTVFTLGEGGPPLKVGRGEAKQKAGKAARAMKPSRHKRTVFELRAPDGSLLRKLFVFTRREVRFGGRTFSPDDETRMLNELTLAPNDKELVLISDKQGGLALTRDGVDVRRDGEEVMYYNEEEMKPGESRPLQRRFKLRIGEEEGMLFDGRIYRSPTSVTLEQGPPRLGMKGGHPAECVRLDRKKGKHTYVFLVRMMRIGSEAAAPIRLGLPGVQESHCRILFSQGKFLIVAPKEDAPVFLGDFQCDPGVVYPLQIDTSIKIGEATLVFRVVEEADWTD
jgi:hypothetical protein